MGSINTVYTEEYCRALEWACGENMMSEGGVKTVEMMFKGIDLKGKKTLDFGSGLGGMAFYIAQHYGANVTGIEINPAMVKTANSRIPANLKDQVHFVLGAENENLPFADKNFDVIFSAGVLVHLTAQQKLEVFKEFYRLLKPGGFLVIRDWISPTNGVWVRYINQLMESEHLPLYACSLESYVKSIKDSSFSEVKFIDYSQVFTRFTEETIKHLKSPNVRQKFIDSLGEEVLTEQIKGYEDIVQAHKTGEIINGLLVALKNDK